MCALIDLPDMLLIVLDTCVSQIAWMGSLLMGALLMGALLMGSILMGSILMGALLMGSLLRRLIHPWACRVLGW